MSTHNPYALRNWLIKNKDSYDIQIELLNHKLAAYNKDRNDIILRLKLVNKNIKEMEDKKR